MAKIPYTALAALAGVAGLGYLFWSHENSRSNRGPRPSAAPNPAPQVSLQLPAGQVIPSSYPTQQPYYPPAQAPYYPPAQAPYYPSTPSAYPATTAPQNVEVNFTWAPGTTDARKRTLLAEYAMTADTGPSLINPLGAGVLSFRSFAPQGPASMQAVLQQLPEFQGLIVTPVASTFAAPQQPLYYGPQVNAAGVPVASGMI